MLNSSKQEKQLNALKAYVKKYFNNNLTDLDESGTRILINTFLSDVLGFIPIEEIRTEYMIKGTYADYMVQTNGIRHFVVEVKALSLALSAKHLRQAVNYAANEGIDWVLLTNGKVFEFYRILFNKPIEEVKVFTIDINDTSKLKSQIEFLQYIHKDAIKNKSLEVLWNKTSALDPKNIASLLCSEQIISFIKKSLKEKHEVKYNEVDIEAAIKKVICDKLDITTIKFPKAKVKKKETAIITPIHIENESSEENTHTVKIDE